MYSVPLYKNNKLVDISYICLTDKEFKFIQDDQNRHVYTNSMDLYFKEIQKIDKKYEAIRDIELEDTLKNMIDDEDR